MARHMFFCEEKTGTTPKKLGNSTTYTYAEGTLCVYRYGKLVFQRKASYREAFEIRATKQRTTVKKLEAPKRRNEIVPWLCGVPYIAVCTSKQQYREKIDNYYNTSYSAATSKEWEVTGSSYAFRWSRKNNKNSKNYCIACFISRAITIEEILQLLPMMRKAGYPDWYLMNVLGELFGITADAFERALANC